MDLETEKHFVVQGMDKFGGSFVNQLGALILLADSNNLKLVKTTWPKYWAKYLKLGHDLELAGDLDP